MASCRRRNHFRKKYWLILCLPFIVILYFVYKQRVSYETKDLIYTQPLLVKAMSPNYSILSIYLQNSTSSPMPSAYLHINEEPKLVASPLQKSMPITSPYQHVHEQEQPILKPSQKLSRIVFVKTHKTGSSTFVNILQRYALKRQKVVLVPAKNHLFSTVKPFQWNFVFNPGSHRSCHQYANTSLKMYVKKADMIFNHLVFNTELMNFLPKASTSQVIPRDNTKFLYVTILRDVVPSFVSRVNYYPVTRILGIKPNGSDFDKAEVLIKHYPQVWDYFIGNDYKRAFAKNVKQLSITNWYMYQLGLIWNLRKLKNPQQDLIASVIKTIESNFNLVMIAEYFDESLILFHEMFDIPFEELIYFKLNSRAVNHQDEEASLLEERKQLFSNMINNYIEADIQIYKYFKTKLENLIEDYGSHRMKSQVSRLHDLILAKKKKCNFELFEEKLPHLKTEVLAPRVDKSREDCQLLAADDKTITRFTKRLTCFNKQF